MNPPPPMLPAVGCVTASANAVATAASMAVPPSRRAWAPISEATAFWETTIALRARGGLRLGEGRGRAMAVSIRAAARRLGFSSVPPDEDYNPGRCATLAFVRKVRLMAAVAGVFSAAGASAACGGSGGGSPAGSLSGSQPSGGQPADVVIVNARVWTVDASRPEAEAVAVAGDRIVAVGARCETREAARADHAGHRRRRTVRDARLQRRAHPSHDRRRSTRQRRPEGRRHARGVCAPHRRARDERREGRVDPRRQLGRAGLARRAAPDARARGRA